MNQLASVFEKQKELCVFAVAIFATQGAIRILQHSKRLLRQYERDDLNARWCCEYLNDRVHVKMFFQLLLTFLFYAYGHPYLFLLNLSMTIWLSRKLVAGYDPDKITNPAQAGAYARSVNVALIIYLACFAIYAYYGTRYAFANVVEVLDDVVYDGEKPSMEGQI